MLGVLNRISSIETHKETSSVKDLPHCIEQYPKKREEVNRAPKEFKL